MKNLFGLENFPFRVRKKEGEKNIAVISTWVSVFATDNRGELFKKVSINCNQYYFTGEKGGLVGGNQHYAKNLHTLHALVFEWCFTAQGSGSERARIYVHYTYKSPAPSKPSKSDFMRQRENQLITA